VASAALLLEESRMEGAHIRRRPDDRHWLRASAISLVLDDIGPSTGMTRPEAARTAALILARVDAGILTPPETEPVAAIVGTVLGADTLAELREIWQAAHHTGDDDTDTMLELGRRWCDIVGPCDDTDTAATGGTPGAGPRVPSDMDRAISDTLARVAAAVASEPLPPDPAEHAARDEQDEADAAADKIARRVFSRPQHRARSGKTRISHTRPPTRGERVAARQLGRALDTAAVRDRAVIKTSSMMPPGRLRMRGALAADAQRAAGALPTAEPVVRTTRKITPAPPLRLGIACDVSGSMHAVADPVASAAWILAHAAHHSRTDATTATVIFGEHVRPITKPGQTPPQVTEFETNDGSHNISTALDALDGALGLSRPGAVRLLVVISDGIFGNRERAGGQSRIDRLRRNGCAVLWLTPPNPFNEPLDGATVHTLTDPTTTARAIAQAATTALRTAH
jgi:hypothetical protein